MEPDMSKTKAVESWKLAVIGTIESSLSKADTASPSSVMVKSAAVFPPMFSSLQNRRKAKRTTLGANAWASSTYSVVLQAGGSSKSEFSKSLSVSLLSLDMVQPAKNDPNSNVYFKFI
jgi:hypothetical protein